MELDNFLATFAQVLGPVRLGGAMLQDGTHFVHFQ